MLDSVSPISYRQALVVIQEYHYSKIMPPSTKLCLGGYKDGKIVAVTTLGYGVDPLGTIKKLFPNLGLDDYLEIGKLCLSDDMPRNSESFFLSKVINFLKHKTKIKILYSWSDGTMGKPGYVYQAANFYYGGSQPSEIYIDQNGVRVHPRSLSGTRGKGKDGNKFQSRSMEITIAANLQKYYGLQFRYLYPICNSKEWKKISMFSTVEWRRNNYPKDNDCKWKKQTSKGILEPCEKPDFRMVKRENKSDTQADMFK